MVCWIDEDDRSKVEKKFNYFNLNWIEEVVNGSY